MSSGNGTRADAPPIWYLLEAAEAMLPEPYASIETIDALRKMIEGGRMSPDDVNRVDMIVACWAGSTVQVDYTGGAARFRPGKGAEEMFWWAATIAAMLEHGGVSGGEPVVFPLIVATVVALEQGIPEYNEMLHDATRFATLLRVAVEAILAGCAPDRLPESPHEDTVNAYYAANSWRALSPLGTTILYVGDVHLAMMMTESIGRPAPTEPFTSRMASRWLFAYKLVGRLLPSDVEHAVGVNGMPPADALTIAGDHVTASVNGAASEEKAAIAAERLGQARRTDRPARPAGRRREGAETTAVESAPVEAVEAVAVEAVEAATDTTGSEA